MKNLFTTISLIWYTKELMEFSKIFFFQSCTIQQANNNRYQFMMNHFHKTKNPENLLKER